MWSGAYIAAFKQQVKERHQQKAEFHTHTMRCYVKLFLRQPDTARDFLAFHLPAPIHALCDMKTLKLESSSFIDDDLRESYSDVLWSVKTEQGPGYIYCLIEHQST